MSKSKRRKKKRITREEKRKLELKRKPWLHLWRAKQERVEGWLNAIARDE